MQDSSVWIRNLLETIAMRYPIGKLYYIAQPDGGAEQSAALDIRIGFERFVRVLSSFFAEMIESGDLEDEAAAVMLGKKILFENATRMLG